MKLLKIFRLWGWGVLMCALVTPSLSSNILERAEADLQELRRESRVIYTSSVDEINKHKKDDLAHPYYAMVDWLMWKTKTSYSATEIQRFSNLTKFLLNHGGHWGWSTTQSMTSTEVAQYKYLACRYFSVNNEASVEENLPHTSTLRTCKEAVRIQTLSDSLVYTYNPEIERWVVMEKLTEDRSKKWGRYALSQDAFQNTGAGSFLQSVTRRFLDSSHHDKTNDMWVAYMSKKQPTDANFVDDIQAENIEMVTSVRAKKGLNLYSPMGIFRTKEGKVAQEVEGAKPRIPHSIYFHAEIARLVKNGYENVKYFWTRPLQNMSNILMKALHPEFNLKKKVLIPGNNNLVVLEGVEAIPAGKLRIVEEKDDMDEASWKGDTDFNTSMNAIIKIEDLIRSIL